MCNLHYLVTIVYGTATPRQRQLGLQPVRTAIQRSSQSLQSLAKRYPINPKTVAKWRKRTGVQDAPMGPKPASTVLSQEQEAIAVAFRQPYPAAPDDCLYALQVTIPKLTRSALHRLFQRHGINRLPLSAGPLCYAITTKPLSS